MSLTARSENPPRVPSSPLMWAAKRHRRVTFAFVLTLGLPSFAAGAPGELDPTFGVGGTVTTDFGGADQANAAVLQADGKIVVAGSLGPVLFAGEDFLVARYLPDGSLDPSFGEAGRVITDFGGRDFAAAVIQQPDGKIVVAGAARSGGAPFGAVALARYLPDGSLDREFGTEGRVTTDIAAQEVSAGALVMQPDRKLVVAVGSSGAPADSADFTLIRYLPDGGLDPDFDVGSPLSRETFASGLVRQPDGKFVVGGHSSDILRRYLPDGNVDPTFGFAGQVDATFYVAALLLQPDDKLVAAGDHVLARYLPDGNPDLGFGIGGQVVTQIGVAALIQEPRGRIVAAGESSGAFALARYLPDGTVDTTFGDGGQVSTDFRELDVALALVRQPDGKLVAAGFTEFRDPDTTRDIALARYDSDLLAGPPANREACKHRRWRTFAVPRAFTNQGDCIQFVNTGK